jgi:hypothetical protein
MSETKNKSEQQKLKVKERESEAQAQKRRKEKGAYLFVLAVVWIVTLVLMKEHDKGINSAFGLLSLGWACVAVYILFWYPKGLKHKNSSASDEKADET